jgi:hypothetical protein
MARYITFCKDQNDPPKIVSITKFLSFQCSFGKRVLGKKTFQSEQSGAGGLGFRYALCRPG